MKKNIIKMSAFALTVAMIFSLAACGGTKNPKSETASTVQTETAQETAAKSLGGWEVNGKKLSIKENAAAKAAFEKATEGLEGYEYEPIALLGTQVAAGINYSILARGKAVVPKAEPSYEIVTVYEDLDGNAEILGEKTLLGAGEKDALGAYEVNDGEYDLSKNADVKAVFDKAFDKLEGADYEVIAYLGSQVAAGTNYLALARVTPVVPDAEPEIDLVTVYEDTKGQAKVSETETVALGSEDADTASESAESEQIPDPYESFTSLKDAAAAAGFDVTLPDAPKGYENVSYRVDTGEKMLEAIYSDKDTDSADAKEAYRIRKAVGSDDISGDYNDYSEKKEVTVSGNKVNMKGNDGKVFTAVWTSGKFTYAIDIDNNGQGLSEDEVTALVNATK